MQPKSPPVVAIFNSMDDILDMVRVAFEAQGFVVTTARLADIQSGDLVRSQLERPAHAARDRFAKTLGMGDYDDEQTRSRAGRTEDERDRDRSRQAIQRR